MNHAHTHAPATYLLPLARGPCFLLDQIASRGATATLCVAGGCSLTSRATRAEGTRLRGNLEVRDTPVRAPRLTCDGLLREEACRGDHGEAAVLQLLGLHLLELCRVGRLQA